MVTAISGSNDSPTAERSLIENGRRLASIPSPGRPVPTELFASAPSNPVLVSHGDIRYFLEPVAPPTTLYVFGGGHIALHLVPLCHRLGFRTVVVDDRVEFISRERFPEADERLAVSRFENALEDFRLGDTSYVVIVTRGHGGDLAVLRQALAHRPGFIGMIGSARKRALIFGQLTQEGVASDVLARVACPVGLPIGAETPEEIAVSIAAQLVAVRRGKA
jgi:xanthine dehydrogenase accessory factor